MKKIFFLVIVVLLSTNIISSFAKENSFAPIRYKIVIDFGTDNYDPLFSDYTLKEIIREKMHQRLPEYYFTESDEANMIINFTLLTQTGEEVNHKFVCALNFFISSYLHNPVNRTILLFENSEESIKTKIRDYLDRWLLEYSVILYKTIGPR